MTDPRGHIKMANLTFPAKFIWLLVRYCLSPKIANNILTWDRAVLVAVMVAVFEIEFKIVYLCYP